MRHIHSGILLLLIIALAACKRMSNDVVAVPVENIEAKSMLQGVWIDRETEEVTFKVKGDSLYFPDSITQPAYFYIVNDSLYIGKLAYAIEKQMPHLFWFHNPNGDLVKLSKSEDPNDSLDFARQATPQPITMNELQKSDSVVMFGGERYHWYIVINPTRYKVSKLSYNDDGVEVENIYYDNIIHISLFNGARSIFSRDFRKHLYAQKVPKDFLDKAVLGGMKYDHVDAKGFHFNAILGIPDDASCYFVDTQISFDGKVDMNVLEN